MLLSDWELRSDPRLRAIVEEFAADEAAWHAAFRTAFKRLTEQGLPAAA